MADGRTALEMADPLLSDADLRPIVYVFHALSHPQRVRILRHLHAHGPTAIKEIRDLIPQVGTGDAWQHIKVLKVAGLVVMIGHGKSFRWEAAPGPWSKSRLSPRGGLLTPEIADP